MNNDINQLQNKKEMKSLIVAQHYTYSHAKRIARFHFLAAVIIPTIINIALIFIKNDIFVGCLSFLTVILLLFCFAIKNSIEHIKLIASNIQQKFDNNIFGLNIMLDVDDFELLKYINKYKCKNWERKKNWYENYHNLSKQSAIFHCQKENIEWTNELSNKYIKFLVGCIIIFVIPIIFNFIFMNYTLIHILSVLITTIPLVDYIISVFYKINNDNKSIQKIKKYAEITEELLKFNKNIEYNILNIQWMIFEFRKTKYLIPDWFDRIYYKKIQSIESEKTKQVNKKQRTD